MERLNPVDLENAQLPTVRKGYETGAVDALLHKAAHEIETLRSELQEMKTECYEGARELKRLKDQENLLTETLVLAQKTAEDVKANAKKEADLILEEARQRARDVVREAEDRNQKAFWDIERLEQQKATFEARFREILEDHLRQLRGDEESRQAA